MAELSVSKKSVSQLLSGMQNNKFIIPDYQRPYSWDKEKCERLWDDIVEFTEPQQLLTTNTYFLGTIVTYRTQQNDHEVIDGQQRITSLLLLLRAF